jgi:hypothetical protein
MAITKGVVEFMMLPNQLLVRLDGLDIEIVIETRGDRTTSMTAIPDTEKHRKLTIDTIVQEEQ